MTKPRFKKFLKIAAAVVVLLLIAVAGAGLYVWRGVKAIPAFYAQRPLEGEERLAAIESVERKVLNLQAVLDRAYARSTGGSLATRPADDEAAAQDDLLPSAGEAEAIAIGFTGPELDTYFRKWLEETGYAPRLERYMENPRIGIADGHVILAGRMPDFGAIVSMHFLPLADDDGAVHLRLEGVYAGRIRLPDAALEKFRTQSVEALGERLAQLRKESDISPEGFANEAAILASSQSQLIELLEGQEIEPLIAFIPLPGRGFVASRVSQLSVKEDELLLGVELLDQTQRQQLLETIRTAR